MRQLINAALVTVMLGGLCACTAGVRVYDEPHRDYHHWNHDEDRVYRVYLSQSHREYREFNKLDKKEQDEYWSWRHSHPNGN